MGKQIRNMCGNDPLAAYRAEDYAARVRYRKKYTTVRVVFGIVAGIMGFFALVFSVGLSMALAPGYGYEGGTLYGLSCASPDLALERETHEVSVYGGNGYNYYGYMPVQADSRYELKNTSSLPLTAEIYLPCRAWDGSLSLPLSATWNGQKLEGKRYILSEYASDSDFAEAKKFSSSRYEIEGLPSSVSFTSYEILPFSFGASYYICAELQGDFENGGVIVLSDGFSHREVLRREGKFVFSEYVYADDSSPLYLYIAGNAHAEFYATDDYKSDVRLDAEPSVKEGSVFLGELIESCLSGEETGEYTFSEYYNLAALYVEKNLFSDFENLGYFRLEQLYWGDFCGVSQAYAAYAVELPAGGTGVFCTVSRFKAGSYENVSGTDYPDDYFYSFGYRAGEGFSSVGPRELLVKSEKFVAKNTGCRLEETLPADTLPSEGSGLYFWNGEPDWKSMSVKNVNGWGRYTLTEEEASFALYKEATLGDANANKFASVFWALVLRLLFGTAIFSLVFAVNPSLIVTAPPVRPVYPAWYGAPPADPKA